MRFSIRHRTTYRYSAPVRLGSHLLRLNPRPDANKLISRDLRIDPTPASREDSFDVFGNLVTRVDFAGVCERFEIDGRFELETRTAAPAAASALPPLPWAGLSETRYLAGPPAADSVRAFAHRISQQTSGDTLAFLQHLNETLYKDIRHDIRADGAARAPEETLALGHGACRDVTILFIAACRALGIPARFVSGYQAEADTPDGRRHLHAWPEAFAPGVGWLGYDPTHLIPVAEGHVALAVAPDQGATMPIEGGFYGVGVTSTLNFSVEIETA